jgi:hypothetical protein
MSKLCWRPGCAGGRIGELGTGAGIGAGWVASAMPADCVLITVEIDELLARAARELLAADSRVEVITATPSASFPAGGPSICSSPTAGCATLQTLLRWSACSASAGASSWTT